MTSDIVEPEIERVRLSLAEENIIEQIRNYMLRIHDVLQELETVLDDLFKDKRESARARLVKVYENFRSIYSTQSALARYVAKVSISISNGHYYLSMIDTLNSLTSGIHRLLLSLGLLSSARTSLGENTMLSLDTIVKQFREHTSHICVTLRLLVENPAKIPSTASMMEKSFDNMLFTLRTLYLDSNRVSQDPLLMNLLALLSALAHNLYDIGEKTVWLYAMRAP
uniref:Phosphate uptake regulator PhoU n=1 Tax=Ignisphaera aggregans TaxID=334771 RepID=A0A7C2VHY6_9CREN